MGGGGGGAKVSNDFFSMSLLCGVACSTHVRQSFRLRSFHLSSSQTPLCVLLSLASFSPTPAHSLFRKIDNSLPVSCGSAVKGQMCVISVDISMKRTVDSLTRKHEFSGLHEQKPPSSTSRWLHALGHALGQKDDGTKGIEYTHIILLPGRGRFLFHAR